MKLTTEWQKPTRSGNNGQCVEARIASINDVALVEVRNSNFPALNTLRFTPDEWNTFRTAVREDNEFQI